MGMEELGNLLLALFSAIVHLQDVLQECYTGGQGVALYNRLEESQQGPALRIFLEDQQKAGYFCSSRIQTVHVLGVCTCAGLLK